MERQIATDEQLRQEKELSRLIEGLNVNQSIALQVLMRGGTVTAAAAAAEVTRQTIYEWMNLRHRFREALDFWKRDLAQCARTRLVMMTDLATSNVAAALKRGDTQTAMKLLEKLGVLAPPAVGPTEQEVRRDRMETQSRMERAQAISTAESLAEVGLWHDEFPAERMGFGTSGGMWGGEMGQATGSDSEGSRVRGDGCGDDRRLRDHASGDDGSVSADPEVSGAAEDRAAQGTGPAGDEGESEGGFDPGGNGERRSPTAP